MKVGGGLLRTRLGGLAHMGPQELQERYRVLCVAIAPHIAKLALKVPWQTRGGPKTGHLVPPFDRNLRIESAEKLKALIDLISRQKETRRVVRPLHMTPTLLKRRYKFGDGLWG